MTYECAPSCGLTLDKVAEYLRHVAQCPRVLPGVAATVAKMHSVPAPTKKPKRRPVKNGVLPFPT